MMRRPAHLVVKLRAGTALARAPAHIDVLAGACRPLGTVDGGGRIDGVLARWVEAARVRRVFHARNSFGRFGEQAARFDEREARFGLPNVLALEVAEPARAPDALEALRDLDAVEWAVSDSLASAPCDVGGAITAADIQRPHARVRAAEALEIEPGRPDVVVAVIDTGIALEHEEFRGKLRAGYDTVDLGMGHLAGGVRLIGDSLGPDYCARDLTGHGSLVAGVIGARGLRLPPGLGGRAAVLPIRVLAAADVGGGRVVGLGSTVDIDAGLQVAHSLGAKVFNMSFGTPLSETDPAAPPPHADITAYLLGEGAICVAAMGNSGTREDYTPAALPGVIAVGSVDAGGARSRFSTTGPHIALSAPGEHVISTALSGYAESTGTSHAAPFVTGAAALLVARARRRGRELASRQARDLLVRSARPLPDTESGAGLLDVPAALDRLDRSVEHEGDLRDG